jgi:hypothetical protein
MERTSGMPIWVYLAFSGIRTRRGALALIGASVLCTLYCVPWPQLFPLPGRLAGLFLVDDWSWFALMVPVTLWYWLSLRWTDRNAIWTTAARKSDS